MNPPTLPEWEAYIETLSGEELRSKALAANSIQFIRQMEAEGMSPADTHAILKAFVRQFAMTGQEPPGRVSGCYLDFNRL